MACKALDGQVAVPADEELQNLLDQFVCVRLVQMHGVDLNRFAFDGSLTWAVFLTNADGTIYARYGSRSSLGKQSARAISLAGFKKSLRGALALHARYVQDKPSVGKMLAGKATRVEPPWPTPEAIPTLKNNARLNMPFVGAKGQRGGCIHCHMVPMHELKSLRQAQQPIHDRQFVPFPMPGGLGFHMDPREVATVQQVRPESVAGQAGMQRGDRILRLAGQPILSTADIQWVLHNAGDEDVLEVEVTRSSGDRSVRKTLDLELATGWRMRLADWRFINQGLLRQTLGFNVKVMPPRQARRFGLAGKLAMFVDRTTRQLRMDTGLGNRDLIVAIDGKRERMTLGALTAYVFRKKAKGSKLKVTIMEIVDRHPRPEHDIEVTVR